MNSVDIRQADELRDLYRELILDHARNPRHFHKLDAATHSAEGINPLCGDKLHLYVAVDDDDTITAAAFLREFVGDVPWAHLDIAGTAYGEGKTSYRRKGGFGVPTRLLVEWVRGRLG